MALHTYRTYLVGCVFVSYLGNIAWWYWAKLRLIAPSPYNLEKIKGRGSGCTAQAGLAEFSDRECGSKPLGRVPMG